MTHLNDLPGSAASASSTHSSVGPDRMLFAFTDDQRPSASLLHACAIARELNSELHVLMVEKPREPFAPIVPLSVKRALTARWIAELVGKGSHCRLEVSTGPFVRDVSDRASQLGARLIVVVPDRQRFGARAAKLARRAAVSVLVSHDAASVGSTVVAATDLADPIYPVLRQAGVFGDVLHAQVVAVHNLNPLLIAGDGSMFGPVLARRYAPTAELERRARQLEQAARTGVHGGAELAVLTSRVRTVDGILQAATAYTAHLIIVGTRAHGWLRQLFRSALAARVVNRASCLVLITPIRGLRYERRRAQASERNRVAPTASNVGIDLARELSVGGALGPNG